MTAPEGLAQDLTDYNSALAALRVTASTSSMHELAQQVVDRLGPKRYGRPIICILCRRSIPGEASIAEMAAWTDEPRCICDECDARITAEVQTQIDAQRR